MNPESTPSAPDKQPGPPAPGAGPGRLRWPLILAAVALLVGLAVLAWFWLLPEPPAPAQPATAFLAPTQTTQPAPDAYAAPQGGTAFEEPLPAAPGGDLLSRMDEAIYAALYQAGLAREDITLKLRSDDQGQVALFEARLPASVDAAALAGSLAQRLQALGARTQMEPDAKGLCLDVFWQERLTHRLCLPGARAPRPTPPPKAARPGKPRLALVVDDMGHQMGPARRLLALDLPITLSLLPYAPHTREIAALAAQHQVEVLVHLPMEPASYPRMDPGPDALLTKMDPQTLRRLTLANLARVPGAKGVNNHMGSAFTQDARALGPVLEVIKQRGLFFLDSLTATRSRVLPVARRLGLPYAQRKVFLDHDPSPRAVTRQLEHMLALARSRGQVIAIGHPHASTLAALERMAPRLRQEMEMVPVSALVHRPGEP